MNLSDDAGQRSFIRQLVAAVALLAIVIVTGWLRTQQLSEIAYWFDESFCVKMAEFSAAEIWERCGQDTHPPVYFLLLKGWGLLFGTSPVALRLLSSVLGAATVVGVFLFVREAYRPRAGDIRATSARTATLMALVAAALVGLSPLHIVWSLQVRMYVLGTTLTAWSSWLLMRALRHEPPRNLDWCLYTLLAILLAYTHYFGLFTLAAQYVFAIGYVWFVAKPEVDGGRFKRRPVILSAICLAVAWQFWLPTFLEQRERVTEIFWTRPPSWELMAETFEELFAVSQRPYARSSLPQSAGGGASGESRRARAILPSEMAW